MQRAAAALAGWAAQLLPRAQSQRHNPAVYAHPPAGPLFDGDGPFDFYNLELSDTNGGCLLIPCRQLHLVHLDRGRTRATGWHG